MFGRFEIERLGGCAVDGRVTVCVVAVGPEKGDFVAHLDEGAGRGRWYWSKSDVGSDAVQGEGGSSLLQDQESVIDINILPCMMGAYRCEESRWQPERRYARIQHVKLQVESLGEACDHFHITS